MSVYNITRAQLQKFLPDARSVKAFEDLFLNVSSTVPTNIDEVQLSADVANNKAEEALALLQSIDNKLNSLSVLSSTVQCKAPKIDYIDFDADAPHVQLPRRMAWNSDEETLDLHHNEFVTQQVGYETYAFIKNLSGVTINNGAAVYISGADGSYPTGVQFIANGTIKGAKLVGLATEQIVNGEKGRINIIGLVRSINTTGVPFGEIWVSGDIVYASTTILGGLTKNKPTAPNLSIPVGVVVVNDSVNGSISVNTIIEQEKYYGSFEKTTTETPIVINTAYPITLTNTVISSGVSIGTPASRVVIANAGLYSINTSYQWQSGSASAKNIKMWYRKNGVDVPNSAMQITLINNSEIKSASRKRLFSLNAGDYIELYYSSDSTNISLFPISSTAWAPASVSFTVTVEQIQQ